MKHLLIVMSMIYLLGAIGVFFVEINVGPVTLGLSGLRALVWPYYVTTGKPEGVRANPDNFD